MALIIFMAEWKASIKVNGNTTAKKKTTTKVNKTLVDYLLSVLGIIANLWRRDKGEGENKIEGFGIGNATVKKKMTRKGN